MMERIHNYQEFEELKIRWNGKFCIFGAGKLGRGLGYELLQSARIPIGFFLDNRIEENVMIVDGIKTRKMDYLYEKNKEVFVFICVSQKYSREIVRQLEQNDVYNYSIIDNTTLALVMESVDKADDSVKLQYHKLYDNAEYLKYIFKNATGYELNLNTPSSFNEKLQWIKVNDFHADYTKYVDKLAFKKYISEEFDDQLVVPLLGKWTSFDDIDFTKLPESYVLKCTHDSGSAIVVKDKYNLNYEMMREKLSDALSINYYWLGREWPYRNAQRMIIAEEYIGNEKNALTDYKIMCFNGEPKLLFTCTDRFSDTGLKVTFFDLNFNKMPFWRHYLPDERSIKRPKHLDKMVELSRELSRGITFVRVDFYEVDDKLYIGEMTFFPGGGMEEFHPVEWDYKLGEYLELPV